MIIPTIGLLPNLLDITSSHYYRKKSAPAEIPFTGASENLKQLFTFCWDQTMVLNLANIRNNLFAIHLFP